MTAEAPAPPPSRVPHRLLSLGLSLVVIACGAALWSRRDELRLRYEVHTACGASGEELSAAFEQLAERDQGQVFALLTPKLDSADPGTRQRAAYLAQRLSLRGGETLDLSRFAPGARVTLALLDRAVLDVPDPPHLDWTLLDADSGDPRLEELDALDLDRAIERLGREARDGVDPIVRWLALRGLTRSPRAAPFLQATALDLLSREPDPTVRQLALRVAAGLLGPADPRPLDPDATQRLAGHVTSALSSSHAGLFLAAVRIRGAKALDPTASARLDQLLTELPGLSLGEALDLAPPLTFAVEDTLRVIPQRAGTPEGSAALTRTLEGPALEAFEIARSETELIPCAPDLLQAFHDLFVRLEDPRWADPLEGIVEAKDRPLHYPAEGPQSFVDRRWCEAPSAPCPQELPLFALLALDPERGFDALRRAPEGYLGQPESPCYEEVWRPRRLSLLAFLSPAARARVAADGARWLKTWRPADASAQPALNAREFLLARHELRHLCELRAAVAIDVLIAEGGPAAAEALASFGRAQLGGKTTHERLRRLASRAALGASLAIRAVPPPLTALAEVARDDLRRDLPALEGEALALALLALSTPRASREAEGTTSALERLLAADPLDQRVDEGFSVWALARARSHSTLGPAIREALAARLPAFLEADDWPWYGGLPGQGLALGLLRTLGPEALARGERLLAEGLDPNFEAEPLNLEHAVIDAIALELGVAERVPWSLPGEGLDAEGGIPGVAQRALFRARGALNTGRDERLIQATLLAEHMQGASPQTPIEQACWLLCLQALEECLRSLGPEREAPPAGAPLGRLRVGVRAPDRARLRVSEAASDAWGLLGDQLSVIFGLDGVECVPSGEGEPELQVTAIGAAPYLELKVVSGQVAQPIPVGPIRTAREASATARRALAAVRAER